MRLGTVTPFLDQAGKVIAIDALREGFQFGCRQRKFPETLEILSLFRNFGAELGQHTDVRKSCLSTVILLLACGDGPAAQVAVNELAGEFEAFPATDDYDTALDILGAFADQVTLFNAVFTVVYAVSILYCAVLTLFHAVSTLFNAVGRGPALGLQKGGPRRPARPQRPPSFRCDAG